MCFYFLSMFLHKMFMNCFYFRISQIFNDQFKRLVIGSYPARRIVLNKGNDESVSFELNHFLKQISATQKKIP